MRGGEVVEREIQEDGNKGIVRGIEIDRSRGSYFGRDRKNSVVVWRENQSFDVSRFLLVLSEINSDRLLICFSENY